jgi:hypothetical protein
MLATGMKFDVPNSKTDYHGRLVHKDDRTKVKPYSELPNPAAPTVREIE